MSVIVALSTVADGSMHNRNDPLDPEIIQNRTDWLASQGVDASEATRLLIRFEGDDYCRYEVVGDSEQGLNMNDDDNFVADALVTTQPGHALLLPVADCIATTIYDPVNEVLMLTHLGRQSLEQNGGVQSVAFLVEQYGSNPSDLQVWTSPTINKDAYKIFKLDNKGMKEVFFEQMDEAGIRRENINDHVGDTGTDDAYFSYSEFLKGNKQVDGCHAMVAVMTA